MDSFIGQESTKCKICGRKLRTWQSLQKGMGQRCEKKYLEEIYRNQIRINEWENENV